MASLLLQLLVVPPLSRMALLRELSQAFLLFHPALGPRPLPFRPVSPSLLELSFLLCWTSSFSSTGLNFAIAFPHVFFSLVTFLVTQFTSSLNSMDT